jgi:hypothetical protein
MKNQLRLRESILGILCVGTIAAALPVAASPLRQHTERGIVQSVDPQQSTLTVRDAPNGPDHSYTWDQNTKFVERLGLFRSHAIGVSDVKPGEQARVVYKHQGNRSVARKIVVTGGKQHKQSAQLQS